MSQSLARVLIHLVVGTKNREPLLTAGHRDRAFAHLGGTLNAIHCPAIMVGGMPDRVHLLFVLSRTIALCNVAEEVKKESSKWANAHVHRGFYWQNGYGVFSVSPSNIDSVTHYIATQEHHHRTRTLQDEVAHPGRCPGLRAPSPSD